MKNTHIYTHKNDVKQQQQEQHVPEQLKVFKLNNNKKKKNKSNNNNKSLNILIMREV